MFTIRVNNCSLGLILCTATFALKLSSLKDRKKKRPKLFSDILYPFETVLNDFSPISKAVIIFLRTFYIFCFRILSTLELLDISDGFNEWLLPAVRCPLV